MTPERVFVGLGANLGDARLAVQQGLAALAALPQTQLVAQSSLYRSAPHEASGPDYINAVAELRTALQPLALLHALQAVELQHGRERPYLHAPRTLDLDLLLYGQRVLSSPGLIVPHPRLHERAFVLHPLLEIAPALSHPALGPLTSQLPGTTRQAIERLP